ncbi:hypothetical protein LTR56_010620 [Elasticomyces elasticus]|nr:hypothetical protein LTR56_010620 [Elasticomyces elasticus]KAK3648643.1 hypothetical protein LTR22_013277 [Elasticomyces elasticus]KAK4932474.1 hypothetical protein LTR49_001345 [Elasticomyces elasticus]KAK5760175.1 hypothetical protein LTS12_009732 [Elasticomyces elasticus]
MDEIEPYEYQPLDPEQKQIRLLELEPGGYDDPLLARLLSVSLDDMPVYNTISYVWGDPSKTSELVICGTRLSVPVNTALALRRMRLDDTVRVLWIDAVCINQKDIHERGQQVSIMGDIYRRSVGNLIHLTDDRIMGERAIKFASQIDKEARAETNEWEEFHSMLYTKDGDFRASIRQKRQDLDSEALWFIVRIPWFRWLHYTTQLDPPGLMELSGTRCLGILATWADPVAGEYHFAYAEREHFGTLVTNARAFERSEPRDGIFAVLGMLTEPTGIVTDYTKPIQAINQEATRLMIQKTNHLAALDTINHEEDFGNGCSWAYRCERTYDPVVEPYHHTAVDRYPLWSLAPPTKLRRDSGDAETIILEGYKIDDVLRTTPVCTADTFERHSSFGYWLYQAAISLGKPFETEQETLAKLAKAITENHGRAGDFATVEDMDAVTAYLSALMRSQGVLDPNTMDQEYKHSLYALFEEAQSRCVFTFVRWRLLFRTTFGRIGLGPKVARSGDAVAVMRGGVWPYVLRSHGEEYQFVGTAYVQDIMRGQAVFIAQTMGWEEQEFVVR